jgi:hypothetical protein
VVLVYITLSWRAFDDADDAAVKQDVIDACHSIPFDRVAIAFDGQIFANSKGLNSYQDAEDLDALLAPLAKQRFWYTVARVNTGEYFWNASELTNAERDKIAEHGG